MLTNNKKRSFVKLIALTLAALMVFSVCLTGCTDEDARLAAEAAKDAADKAQSSADAAQTAADGKTTTEAVAAQIAEALKPYLKADAALTEADVDKKVADLKAAIEASLKNYQAKGDYATKADVDKKQNKGDYATKTELTNAVKDALKPYLKASDALTAANVKSAIDTALAGYQVKGDYATKTEVTEAVKNALKGYATEAGVDAAIDAAVADFATKAEVTAALEAFASYAKSEDLADLSEKLTAAMGAALTADDVALIVKNAMADYAIETKIADAIAAQDELTMAAVTELVNETLGAYLTAEEIEARFAASQETLDETVAALRQELADAKAELEAADTAAAAELEAKVAELEAALAEATAALESADAATDASIKAEIAELEAALAAAKEELNAKIDETKAELEAKIANLEAYFGTFTAEQVVTLLGDVDKKMDKDEWKAATLEVTNIIKKTNKLFNKVVVNSYTQENKAEINKIMGNINGMDTHVVIFPKTEKTGYLNDAVIDTLTIKHTVSNQGDVNDHQVAGSEISAKVLTDLTVFILRAATYDEIMEISAAIDKALAVKTFEDEMKDWREALYDIGVEAEVITDKTKGTAATWSTPGDGAKYHGTAIADKSVMKAQVAVAADRGLYDDAIEELEEMVVEYALESMYFSHYYKQDWQNAVRALYANIGTDGKVSSYTWKTPGSYKGETWNGVDVSALAGATDDVPAGMSFVGIYAGINSKAYAASSFASGVNVFSSTYSTAAGKTMKGFYDNTFMDPLIKVDLENVYTTGGRVSELLNQFTPAGDKVELADTYAALNVMTTEAQDAINKANDLFTGNLCTTPGYLWHIGHDYKDTDSNTAGHQCGCALKSKDWYVTELKDYMVEQTESDATLTVPTDWAANTTWLTPVVAISGDVAPWNYSGANAAQAKTIDVYFNYAHNINGVTWTNGKAPEKDTIGIKNYDIYLALVEEAWNELYGKYKSYAAQILTTMRNDFRIAAQAAVESGALAADYTKTLAESAKNLNLKYDENAIVRAYTNDGYTNLDTMGSFLKNYAEGKEGWYWSVGKNIPKQVGHKYNLEGILNYYKYNDSYSAKLADISNGAVVPQDVVSEVLTELKNNWLRIEIELDSVTVGPRDDILNDAAGEIEAKKAKFGRVQDAFNDELQVAMDNLQEIMYRYMYKEINDYYLNYAYASIDMYNAYNSAADDNYVGGVAKFFANAFETVTDEDLAELTYMLQVYVTGYAEGTAPADGFVNGYNETRDKDGKLIGVSIKTADVTYPTRKDNNAPRYVSVTPGYVYNELKENKLVASDFAVDKVIAYPATAVVKNAKAIYDDAINTMANTAVKFRFDDYIEYATEALNMVYDGYKAVLKDRDQGLDLAEAFNEATKTLTIAQYYSDRGMIEDDKYLNQYVTLVLGTAAAYDSNHITLFKKDTTFEKQLRATVASAAAFTDGVTLTGYAFDVTGNYTPSLSKYDLKAEWVGNKDLNDDKKIEGDAEQYGGDILIVVPQSPRMLNGTPVFANYYAVGSAVEDFDQILNKDTKNDSNVLMYAQ